MTDDLRTRIMAAIERSLVAQFPPDLPDRYGEWIDNESLADAVIRELASDCIYRYSCANCGDFWFDTSARMQRFALLHNRSHLAVIQETKQCEKVSKADE